MIKNPTELNIIIQNLKDGNLDDSLKKIKEITITNSNNNLICKLYASIYFQKKNWENSIKYLQKMLFFEDKKFGIYNNIGVALFNLGKINESIEAYKKATIENPNFDLAYENMGISYNELGAYEKAAKSFSKALNLNENNHNAKNNLISLFLVCRIDGKNENSLIKINNKIKNIDNKITINNSISGQTQVFSEVDKKMSAFISEKMNVDLVKAKEIQKKYFYEYGTTLSGLMKQDGIDPHDFLEFVHDIDISWLPKDLKLREELIKIKEKKSSLPMVHMHMLRMLPNN